MSSESACMPSALPFGRFRMHLTVSSAVNDMLLIGTCDLVCGLVGNVGEYASFSG